MTTQQILNVLYPARQAYREAIEVIQNSDTPNTFNYLRETKLFDGMCYTIKHYNEKYLDLGYIKKVLEVDIYRDPSYRYTPYWYAEPIHVSDNKMVELCLQPRLDHLNRTITRLQNELIH